MIARKWLARSRPLGTHVGFSTDWTTAIPSMITTLLPTCWRCYSSWSGWANSPGCSWAYSCHCNGEGHPQNWTALWEMQPTRIHYWSSWDRFQVRKEPRREKVQTKPYRPLEQRHQMLFYSSVSLMWSAKCEGLLSSFACSTILSFTKLLKWSCPIWSRSTTTSFTVTDITAFVIILIRLFSSLTNGAFALNTSFSFFMITFSSQRIVTASEKSWWCLKLCVCNPTMASTSEAWRLNSGAIRNHLQCHSGSGQTLEATSDLHGLVYMLNCVTP